MKTTSQLVVKRRAWRSPVLRGLTYLALAVSVSSCNGDRLTSPAPTTDVSLRPVAITASTLVLSTTSLTLASPEVGTTSAAQAVTLRNVGNDELKIKIKIKGKDKKDFDETDNCGKSLAAGASCTINVTFTPSTTGTRTATLTIDDKDNATQTVALTGMRRPLSPALRSFTTATTGLIHLASVTIATPTSRTGDVLLLFLAASAAIDPIGLSGWTEVDYGDAGSSLRGRSYYRIAAAEPASYTITFGSAIHFQAAMLAYSGVNTADPISANAVVADGNYYTEMTAPALSGVGANDLVVVGFHARGTGETTTVPPTVGPFGFVPPGSGWTEVTQQTTTDPDDPNVGISVVQKAGGIDTPSETASPSGFQFTRVITGLALRALP